MKRFSTSLGLALLLSLGLGAACRRTPAIDAKVSNPPSSQSSEVPHSLLLKKGMQIKLRQSEVAEDGKLLPSKDPSGWSRTVTVENPSGAEGMAFAWDLPGAEKASSGEASVRGKMTLANLVGARRMTLPLFWPAGELFLSNSSAIWLSDQAFADLQKQGKTNWSLGIVDNALLGPAQGVALLESALEIMQRSLETKADQKAAAGELVVADKSIDFPMKVNGVEREVEAIEAENWLAKLKILKNPQNPLILEFEVAPNRSVASNLFFPLSWTRKLLSYKVEEIPLPQ